MKTILFADDTNLLCCGNNLGKLLDTVEKELGQMKSCFVCVCIYFKHVNTCEISKTKNNTKVDKQDNLKKEKKGKKRTQQFHLHI